MATYSSWTGLVLAGVLSLGCQSRSEVSWTAIRARIRTEFPAVKQVSTRELSLWLLDDQRVQPVLLDARTREEFDVSHLSGARLATNMADASSILSAYPKSQPVIVYCSVGIRSSRLADELQNAGYIDVYNLDGSLFQWVNEGRVVIDSRGTTDHAHPFDASWGKLLNRRYWYNSQHISDM